MKARRISLKYLSVAGLSLLICLMYLWWGQVGYETNDDETLNLIAAGAYGPESQYLIYTNILYGYLLKMLYALFPGLNWYIYLMIGWNLLCIAMISLIISRHTGFPMAIFSCVLVNFFLAPDFYLSLQYTKNAALYTMTAALILGELLDLNQRWKRILLMFPGVFFCLLGLCTRRDSFLLMLPFAAVVIGSSVWRHRDRLPTLKGELTFLGSTIVLLCGIAILSDYYAYHQSEQWQYYLRYNEYRTELLDYGFPDYTQYRTELEGIGIDEVDLALLASWTYADNDKFSAENLQSIGALKDTTSHSLRVNQDTILSTFKGVYEALTSHILPVAVLLLILLAVLMGDGFSLLLSMIALLFTIGEYWFLSCLGRVVWRAECGIFLAGGILLLAGLLFGAKEIQGNTKTVRHKAGILVLTVGLLLIQSFSLFYVFTYEKQGRRVTEQVNLLPFIQHTQAMDDTIYVMDTFTMSSRSVAPSPFVIDGSYKGLYRNIALLGGWTVPSPVGQYYSREAGIDNVMEALVKDDRLLLVDNSEEHVNLILQYIQKEYAPEAQAEKVDQIDGLLIWKIKG